MITYLFDLDGTLTDSRKGLFDSFRTAFRAIGAEDRPDDSLNAFLGAPLPVMFRAVKPEVTPIEIDSGIAAFRTYYEAAGIHENRLYPGVRDMLGLLRHRGHPAWVVTSKPEHYAIAVVENLGLTPLVDGVVGAGLSETDTKTELVARALLEAGAEPADTMMVGDRHYDVIGAVENGVTAVGVLWGYGSYAELCEAGCRYFAESPAEFTEKFVGGGGVAPKREVARRRAF
jgi:phosphoglycolate phosphatase